MAERRCLYCYEPLSEAEGDYHERCSLQFFGSPTPPVLDYSRDEMKDLAADIVLRSVALTGVQEKLSLTIEKQPGDPKKSRLTIVGLWGNFILKPPSEEYGFLPENEDLTMHLGRFFDLETAEHSLIRLKSGELAYITKRFDRVKGQKLALEDMCQLTETLTVDKYRGSMERIGRQIERFSSNPGLDALTFFESSLFCFLTGNADMHLKNFSLLTESSGRIGLSPAYDMLCTKLALPGDAEEMALTLNARRSNIQRKDFDAFANHLKITDRVRDLSYRRFGSAINHSSILIDVSFLPENYKEDYKKIIFAKGKRLKLV